MYIGIYGNDGNLGYRLAESLRLLGHQTRLVVTRPEACHRPEWHDPRLSAGYPDWMFDAGACEYSDYACLSPRVHHPMNFVGDCDLLILNHLGLSLASLLGRRHLALLTGPDLALYASYALIDAMNGWSVEVTATPGARAKQRVRLDLIMRQREGIATAERVIFPTRGLVPDADALLAGIGVREASRVFLRAGDAVAAPAAPRAGGPLRILYGTRLNGQGSWPMGTLTSDHTGADVMLEGVAQFVHRRPAAAVELRLIERGWHVAETKNLVARLRLDQYVTWLAERPSAEYLAEIVGADIVIGSCGPAPPGAGVWTAMLAGKPVIANFHPQVLAPYFGAPVPGCHATTPDDIASWLDRLTGDAGERTSIGRDGQRFAAAECSLPAQMERLLANL